MSDFPPEIRSFEFYLDHYRLRVKPPFDGKEPDPLSLSITKWEAIVDFLERGYPVWCDGGAGTCALCCSDKTDRCQGCPVSAKTKEDACQGTPYWDWALLPEKSDLSERLKVARAEIAFLGSLQPRSRPTEEDPIND